MIEIRPHEGPQTQFLSSLADIAIYGGAAGGGKSHALLMEPLRRVTTTKGFEAVIFRRTLADAKKPGATWDKTVELYGPLAGKPRFDMLRWEWPEGGKITVGHLEHETTVLDWQSAEICLELFDELTHFTRGQFFYMLSRNRSMCGVIPYVRATCNPDADSWVADFIEWWIDPKTGRPIPERSSVIRWFIRMEDDLVWRGSREQLFAEFGVKDDAGNLLADDHHDQIRPKSMTFIASDIYDNPTLLKKDPGYLANLKALPTVERERLLGGNWKIRPAAGLMFRREWVQVVEVVPEGLDVVRYWDLAATEKTQNNDPDWTVGVRMTGSRLGGVYYITHVSRMRVSPMKVEDAVMNTATSDTKKVRIGMAQDPGQAGKSLAQSYVKKLAGFNIRTKPESGDKVTRFGPFSAQCQAGNVRVLRGAWNEAFFDSLEGFPDARHDDDADACSGAFDMLTGGKSKTAVVRELIV